MGNMNNLFGASGSTIQQPALTQLAQLLQALPKQQGGAQAPAMNSQTSLSALPQGEPAQQGQTPQIPITQGLGKLAQSLGFGASPAGTYGPFNGGSALSALGNQVSNIPTAIANWFSGGGDNTNG